MGDKPTVSFQDLVCDFRNDCTDDSDEEKCPQQYLFENCEQDTGEAMCYWEEEPTDELDWKIAAGISGFFCFISIANLNITANDEDTSDHGPYSGGDHFLFLKGKLGPGGDYIQQVQQYLIVSHHW